MIVTVGTESITSFRSNESKLAPGSRQLPDRLQEFSGGSKVLNCWHGTKEGAKTKLLKASMF